MDIEITVFDEINDYKEKIYFFNFRQWAFAILIIALVVPIYILLKDRIGDELTSYIVIRNSRNFRLHRICKNSRITSRKDTAILVSTLLLFC